MKVDSKILNLFVSLNPNFINKLAVAVIFENGNLNVHNDFSKLLYHIIEIKTNISLLLIF